MNVGTIFAIIILLGVLGIAAFLILRKKTPLVNGRPITSKSELWWQTATEKDIEEVLESL